MPLSAAFTATLPDILPEAAAHVDAGHGETMLVIDDEDAVPTLMMDVLELAGYRVLTQSTDERS